MTRVADDLLTNTSTSVLWRGGGGGGGGGNVETVAADKGGRRTVRHLPSEALIVSVGGRWAARGHADKSGKQINMEQSVDRNS